MKSLWVIIALVGVIAAILSMFVLVSSPSSGGDYPAGYGKPVTAFEFASSSDDLIGVFGTNDDPMRPERISAMRTGVYWDFPFILAFGLFLALWFRAIQRSTGNRLWFVFAVIAIVAAFADAVEDLILLGLLSDPIHAPNIALLKYPVYLKFFGLAVVNIAAGVFITRHHRLFWRILGLLTIFGGLAALTALAFPKSLVFVLTNAIAVGWIAMLAFAVSRILQNAHATQKSKSKQVL